MAKSVYDIIKKQNGEKFAKAIRNYDSGIFDINDIDKIVKFAGKEAEPIMNYLISLKDVQIEEHGVHKSPFDLLREAGYVSVHADTLEKQNNPDFMALYADGEAICTFRDNHRFENYHIIHCIKENIKDIKRGNPPKRQDEYGTSAISIQIAKRGGFISIKNRYNHTVDGCDNTFDSNPDNIIKGLSESLKHHFGVDFSSRKIALPRGYTFMNGQILKYNSEANNVYFGQDFYASNGQITQIDKLREILIDNVVLNLSTKDIKNPAANDDSCKSFAIALKKEIEGRKLLVKNNNHGNKCLFANGVQILEIDNGNTVALNFPNVTEIGDDFIYQNRYIKSVNMQNLEKTGNGCFVLVSSLTSFDAPKLRIIGEHSFFNVNSLTSFNAPNLEEIKNNCFGEAESLISFNTPNLKKLEGRCFIFLDSLTSFDAPKLQIIGSSCFINAEALTSFDAPNLKIIEGRCFENVSSLTSLKLNNLQEIKDYCFEKANSLTTIQANKLETIGYRCFREVNSLESLETPNLITIKSSSFENIDSLTSVDIPNLQNIGDFCFNHAEALTSFNAPNLRKLDARCFGAAESLTTFNAPKLKYLEKGCFQYANNLIFVNIPEHLIPDNIKKQITKQKAHDAKYRVSSLVNKKNTSVNKPNKNKTKLSISPSKEKSCNR